MYFGKHWKIDGLATGSVFRTGPGGDYRVTFEREYASIEEIERIDWTSPAIEPLDGRVCPLPAGYGFDVKRIEYNSAMRCYTVVLTVREQYLGDVTGYQAELAEKAQTIETQAAEIDDLKAQLEEADNLALELYEAQNAAADGGEEATA